MELHLFPTSEDCTVGFLFLYPLTCILIHPYSTLHPFIMVSCLVYWSGRDLNSPSRVESNHRALGSASRNNKVPRLLTPAGAYRLVWPRTTVQKRWVFLGIGKHSCCLNMHFAYPADMLLSKSQSLTCTAPRKGWMCHWTEFRLKRPSAVLHRA